MVGWTGLAESYPNLVLFFLECQWVKNNSFSARFFVTTILSRILIKRTILILKFSFESGGIRQNAAGPTARVRVPDNPHIYTSNGAYQKIWPHSDHPLSHDPPPQAGKKVLGISLFWLGEIKRNICKRRQESGGKAEKRRKRRKIRLESLGYG